VCGKLGFSFWKQAWILGGFRNLYTLAVGQPAPQGGLARPG
jgi:hypothetical protein